MDLRRAQTSFAPSPNLRPRRPDPAWISGIVFLNLTRKVQTHCHRHYRYCCILITNSNCDNVVIMFIIQEFRLKCNSRYGFRDTSPLVRATSASLTKLHRSHTLGLQEEIESHLVLCGAQGWGWTSVYLSGLGLGRNCAFSFCRNFVALTLRKRCPHSVQSRQKEGTVNRDPRTHELLCMYLATTIYAPLSFAPVSIITLSKQ